MGVCVCVCACRTYCETDIDPAHRKLSQLQAVVLYLTGKEPDLDCKCTLLFQDVFNPAIHQQMDILCLHTHQKSTFNQNELGQSINPIISEVYVVFVTVAILKKLK